MSDILLYTGSIIIIIWGIAHIAPTRGVVNGFGELSTDNRRILIMEWIAEGLTMVFIGLLVLLVSLMFDGQNEVAIFVYRASAVMLLVMAGLSAMTGARTSILPMKLCPYIKTVVAVLVFLGSVI
jgi:hypothetical protein